MAMNANDKYDPREYFIHLELDVNSEKFSGITKINLVCKDELEHVILNCESLNIQKCMIREDNEESTSELK